MKGLIVFSSWMVEGTVGRAGLLPRCSLLHLLSYGELYEHIFSTRVKIEIFRLIGSWGKNKEHIRAVILDCFSLTYCEIKITVQYRRLPLNLPLTEIQKEK